MEILIQNKYMKGNSWSHCGNPSLRFCPLYEALSEKFPDEAISVGSFMIRMFNKHYYISDNWHMEEAIRHIANAQTDENYTVMVTLILRE